MMFWNLVMVIEHDVETVASAVEEIIKSIGGVTHVVNASALPAPPAVPPTPTPAPGPG